jgi:DNA repair photolyase
MGNGKDEYNAKHVKAVDVAKVRKLLEGKTKSPFNAWIKAKKPIQWGGLSDPFCHYEENLSVGLELLRLFNEFEYPISFSSKSTLPTRNPEYLAEFKKAGSRWHYKASIITLDPEKSKLVEKGTPSPQERVENLRRLNQECGTLTTWRLRPFIVGLTDLDLEEQIKTAKEIGCQSITTEFFCLERRSYGKNKTLMNYQEISKACGFSLIDFYKKFGTGAGFVRLNSDFIKPYVWKYVNLCEKYDLKYFISDAHHKDKNCSGSCCGLLDSNEHFNGYAREQWASLLQIAKTKGFITFAEAKATPDEAEREWRNTAKVGGTLNVAGTKASIIRNMTYEEYFERQWDRGFFEKYFEGLVFVGGKGKDGHAIYFFNYKKATI